jgi:hypothetical protein
MVSHSKTSPATAKAKSRSGKQHAAAASQTHNRPANHKNTSTAPVVVDAGRTSKSSLRHLEQGTGPLVHEITQIVHGVRAAVPKPGSIVIVYQEKRSGSSRSASLLSILPFSEWLPI